MSRWLPAVAWMAVIFWFSSLPDAPALMPNATADLVLKKLAHAGAYAILAMLAALAALPQAGTRAAMVGFVVAAVYAMTDELHQAFVPPRHASVVDVAIDWAGAAVGAALIWRWRVERPGE